MKTRMHRLSMIVLGTVLLIGSAILIFIEKASPHFS